MTEPVLHNNEEIDSLKQINTELVEISAMPNVVINPEDKKDLALLRNNLAIPQPDVVKNSPFGDSVLELRKQKAVNVVGKITAMASVGSMLLITFFDKTTSQTIVDEIKKYTPSLGLLMASGIGLLSQEMRIRKMPNPVDEEKMNPRFRKFLLTTQNKNNEILFTTPAFRDLSFPERLILAVSAKAHKIENLAESGLREAVNFKPRNKQE